VELKLQAFLTSTLEEGSEYDTMAAYDVLVSTGNTPLNTRYAVGHEPNTAADTAFKAYGERAMAAKGRVVGHLVGGDRRGESRVIARTNTRGR
jgi:hypothetical protein